MNLRDYLYHNRIKIAHFAKKVPCAPVTLGAYINKRARVGPLMAKAISEATKGEVSVDEIIAYNRAKMVPPKVIKT